MSVYFLEHISRRHLKIGRSGNPERRMQELAIGFSLDDLKLRAVIPGSSHEEKVLHSRFYDQRLRGEWFRLEGELEYVVSVAEKLGSLDTLPWFRINVDAQLASYERDRNQVRPESSWLADNVRRLRQRQHLTQKDLADAAEVPRTTVANLESAISNPTLSVLVRVSEALGVPLQHLLIDPSKRDLL